MRDDERLVLLAWPRSGSSSLWQILGKHPDLRLLADEPFNENFTKWAPGNPDYLARIRDVESLDGVLDELFRSYRGIKVLSYQLDEEQLTHVVLRRDLRVVFIRRRNLLQTAVSDRIAKQTGLYNRWDLDAHEPIERRYDALEPLDLDDLRGYVRNLASHFGWLDSVLARRGDAPTLRLSYEDLFLATLDAQRAQLAAVWSFLDVAPFDSPDVDAYLDPRTAKLGVAGTYGQLPNVVEINAALGADDTGWLVPFYP